jgi:2-isopropylmalate synthase
MSEYTYVDREDRDSLGALVASMIAPPEHSNTYVRIFDTTLRDGEQSPGASMTFDEKLRVAEQLVRLGVDIIEAGFPAASPGDLAAVDAIARRTRGVAVAALARANRADIDACWQALDYAEQPVLHVFVATSDLHLQYKLGKTREEVLAQVEDMVGYGRRFFAKVEFSAEDATRSDWGYLSQVYTTAIRAGATVVNIPDTVGYTMPSEYAALIAHLRATVPGIENVTISAHCHDDLGMATANTLAAIMAGAGQIEVTINGLGERAGNTSLEEVVMALRTRADACGGYSTRIVTDQLVPTSQLVSRITGIPVPPNKAIVGANAFAHEAGIHQDGMLKHPGTYEIMTPCSVGWPESKLVLGKHSGRHGFDARLRQLGYRLRGEELQRAYTAFIAYVDQHKFARDEELCRIAEAASAIPAAQQEGAGETEAGGMDGAALSTTIVQPFSAVGEASRLDERSGSWAAR